MAGAAFRPLGGLRVVDMADEKAELCGRLLADLGADVIRIEPPGGAGSRHLPPFYQDRSLWFEVRNSNKRSATVDLQTAEGRDVLLELLAGADVWIDTSRPGALAPLGLDPAAVSARLPQLVVISVTAFGQTGPYRDFVATDPVIEAMAWVLYRAGVPELPPVLPPGNLAYDMIGAGAAFAVLTACLDRRATGRGQFIDMSAMEAVAQLTDWALTSYSVISKLGRYGEVRDGGGKAYPVIPCQDGCVRIGIVTLAEWRKLRAWLGDPEMIAQDIFDDQRNRIELWDELIEPVFVEWMKDRRMIDLAVEGQALGIPITPMLEPGDVLQAEQFVTLGTFTPAEVGPGVTGLVPSGFFSVDGERMGYRTPAPAPGAVAPTWADRLDPAGRTGGVEGRPYSGLRVVEFGVAGAVPEMARLLAEYGADVIRVESPRRVDLFRQLGGPSGVGSVFASSNRSSRSLGVDFTQPAGAAIALRLIEGADVILENLPPGTLDRYGVGFEAIRRVNSRAFVISSQMMGLQGPWSHWRGYGANTQLPGGMSWLWSFPELDQPVPQNVAFPDHFVGRLGATIVAAHLLGSAPGHEAGHHAEIVQAEMAVNLLADLFLKESLEPGSVRPAGNRSPLGSPWGLYQCDGEQRWCVITCRTDEQWHGLVDAMGQPDWATRPEYEAVEGRRAAQDAIDAGISEWTLVRSDRDVMNRLQSHGVPAGMMMYISEQIADPHLIERGYLLEIDQPGVGPVLLEGPAFHATGLPDPITGPAPFLGQHTRAICRELLGYDDAEIDRLIGAELLFEPTPEATASSGA